MSLERRKSCLMVRQRHPEVACLSGEARDRAQWASSVQPLWEDRPSQSQCLPSTAHLRRIKSDAQGLIAWIYKELPQHNNKIPKTSISKNCFRYWFLFYATSVCLPECMYTTCVPGTRRGQRVELDLPKVEWQTVVSHHVSVRYWIRVLYKNSECF